MYRGHAGERRATGERRLSRALLALALALVGCDRQGAPATATPATTPPPRVVVVGFEPFAHHAHNPTAGIARELGARPGWRGEVLPVDPEHALERLHPLIAEAPEVVVALGIREGLDTIQLNPAALNWVSMRDHDQDLWYGPLDPSLPVEVRALAADVADAQARLEAAGVAFETSDDAGMNVCNAALFHGIVHAPIGTRFHFLHVPPVLPPARRHAVIAAVEALARP